ncbi:MAG: polysaccharide biosynthesis/export family protein [Rhodobacterales bacterium]|nr:polysaccharide biosynthesis/export family protein [Rhodobacterales bacterium]
MISSPVCAQKSNPVSNLGDYVISVGDELQLDFLDDERDPYLLPVDSGGGVQLPFLGTVEVAGLGLPQAREVIARSYVEREILIAPQLDLSIVTLRAFSVLGDVQTPGFFDFRANITVEEAVGMAGGPARVALGEENIALQQAALRGESASYDSALLREAVVAARLRAQLEGKAQIDPGSVKVDDIIDSDSKLITSLIAQDEEIIAAEQAYFESEQNLLKEAVTDVTLQIELTKEQIVAQTAQIETYDAELESSAELSDRGLITAPVRARLLRQVADEETALLRLRTNLAATRRDLTGLRRELLGLDFRRTQAWRQELADLGVRTAQLRASRDSVEERLDLLADLAGREVGADAKMKVTYFLRRRTDDMQMVTRAVKATDTLMPADVLIVHIERRRRTSGQVGQIAE